MVLENGKEVRIIADENGCIKYELIEKDAVNRQEVADVKFSIETLEKEIEIKNGKLDELKAKLELAEKIIQLADEKKALEEAEAEANAEDNEVEYSIDETLVEEE